MALPTLWQTFKNDILSLKSIVLIIFIAFIYYSFSVLLINYRLIQETIFSNNPLFYKFKLMFELITGAYVALGLLDFFLLTLASVLVAVNLLLLFKTLKSLRKERGKLSLTVGGVTVLGVLVAGSCSCGFSILSVLGLTGAISFLPFKGLEIHLLVIALLIFSSWYSLRTYHKKIACKIK